MPTISQLVKQGRKQIAEKLNISRSYVSRIEKKVINKLRLLNKM